MRHQDTFGKFPFNFDPNAPTLGIIAVPPDGSLKSRRRAGAESDADAVGVHERISVLTVLVNFRASK